MSGQHPEQTEPVVDAGFIRRWINMSAAEIAASRDYLTQLDAAIGDADHGINMERGFSAAVTDIEAPDVASPGQVLERVGTTLVYRVGGAAGPLFGTMYRNAGIAAGTEERLDPEGLLSALRAGLTAVQTLGAAVEGDKTMVDAYAPAFGELERSLRSGGDLGSALAEAAAAAREGMRATIPMQARKGRASYLGSRSVGHQDPGATSVSLLFLALSKAADGTVQ